MQIFRTITRNITIVSQVKHVFSTEKLFICLVLIMKIEAKANFKLNRFQ